MSQSMFSDVSLLLEDLGSVLHKGFLGVKLNDLNQSITPLSWSLDDGSQEAS